MKKKNKEIEPLMKRGSWVVRFLSIKKAGKKEYIEWYFAGIWPTAQEAFRAGNEYAVKNEELFKKQSGGFPERMVLELMKEGLPYPKSNEVQLQFGFIPSSDGPYMDSEGVTRGSYMLRRGEGE